MIISHAHRFIFIKTMKTAGTSIEAALSEVCGPEDVITPFSPENESFRSGRAPQNYRLDHPLVPKRPLWRRLLGRPERYYHASVGYYEHMPAQRIKAYAGDEVWNGYFKFAFERNPWDRQVSYYLYKTRKKHPRPSFEAFMRNRRKAFVDNHALYTIDGEIAVDFLGRYETLQTDFQEALRRIGVEREVALPQANVSSGRGDFRQHYDSALRARVAEWYAPEITALDYRFE
ncbi:MAG: sulfotransferase family 2 domain-containing protein [Hyphococcus sp.]